MKRRRALRVRLRAVLAAPGPGAGGARDAARREHDWWLLHGPRWH
jgi:hypothetical protein